MEDEHLCSNLSMMVEYRDPLRYFFPRDIDIDMRKTRVKCEKISNNPIDPYLLTIQIPGMESIVFHVSRNSIEGIYFVSSSRKLRLALYHAGDCVRIIDPDNLKFFISLM
jgi:hypothetical protein